MCDTLLRNRHDTATRYMDDLRKTAQLMVDMPNAARDDAFRQLSLFCIKHPPYALLYRYQVMSASRSKDGFTYALQQTMTRLGFDEWTKWHLNKIPSDWSMLHRLTNPSTLQDELRNSCNYTLTRTHAHIHTHMHTQKHTWCCVL